MTTLEYLSLTSKERQAFRILKKIEGDSIWQIATKEACNGSISKFRTLLSQLYSQSKDCEMCMTSIIGIAGLNAVKACFEPLVKLEGHNYNNISLKEFMGQATE